MYITENTQIFSFRPSEKSTYEFEIGFTEQRTSGTAGRRIYSRIDHIEDTILRHAALRVVVVHIARIRKEIARYRGATTVTAMHHGFKRRRSFRTAIYFEMIRIVGDLMDTQYRLIRASVDPQQFGLDGTCTAVTQKSESGMSRHDMGCRENQTIVYGLST